MNHKEDFQGYYFCYNVRQARKDVILGKGIKLTEDRISAIFAIGFEWNPWNIIHRSF